MISFDMKPLVSNVFEFIHHINLHRKRVFKLGWSLKHECNNRIILWLVLKVHDIEKYFYLLKLWKLYGRPDHEIPNRELFDSMNKIGKSLQKLILLPFRNQRKSIKQALEVERIADVVDRNSDPVAIEEFHLKQQIPMSHFLPAYDLDIAYRLKEKWDQLTYNLQYY